MICGGAAADFRQRRRFWVPGTRPGMTIKREVIELSSQRLAGTKP
jgi:hypothetical protein